MQSPAVWRPSSVPMCTWDDKLIRKVWWHSWPWLIYRRGLSVGATCYHKAAFGSTFLCGWVKSFWKLPRRKKDVTIYGSIQWRVIGREHWKCLFPIICRLCSFAVSKSWLCRVFYDSTLEIYSIRIITPSPITLAVKTHLFFSRTRYESVAAFVVHSLYWDCAERKVDWFVGFGTASALACKLAFDERTKPRQSAASFTARLVPCASKSPCGDLKHRVNGGSQNEINNNVKAPVGDCREVPRWALLPLHPEWWWCLYIFLCSLRYHQRLHSPYWERLVVGICRTVVVASCWHLLKITVKIVSQSVWAHNLFVNKELFSSKR